MFENLQIRYNDLCLSRSGLLVPIYYFKEENGIPAFFAQQTYARDSIKNYDMDYTFEAELQYENYDKGQSSVTMVFCNELFRGEMFLSDFSQLILSGIDVSKPIRARWKFCKKGSNIGLITDEIFAVRT